LKRKLCFDAITRPRPSRAKLGPNFAWLSVLISFLFAGWPLSGQTVVGQTEAATGTRKRPVTVADTIRMMRNADPYYVGGAVSKGSNIARFSPDGSKFVVTLRKGNLQNNTNEYCILIWQTVSALHSPGPEVVLTLSSYSNREAITDVSWLNDNETVVFLGENSKELRQVYSLNVTTRELNRITNHRTNVVSYSISGNGDQLAFVAEREPEGLRADEIAREGVVISNQSLQDLIRGRSETEYAYDLFLKRRGFDNPVHLKTVDAIAAWDKVAPSPDGKYLVVTTRVIDIPENWKDYEDPYFGGKLLKTSDAFVERYTVIDTNSGTSRPLVDAPVGPHGSEIVWSQDSRSVLVAGVYLPLNISDATEQSSRQNSIFVAEIHIPSGEITKITREDLELLMWDARSGRAVFAGGRAKPEPRRRVVYLKRDGKWEQVEADRTDVNPSGIDVALKEDLNTPPTIVVSSMGDRHESLLLDLNPEFSELNFAMVEEIEWKGSDGHDVKGGLYRPLGYIPEARYPLVIQSHGFRPDRFWIDGPFTTGFAAQPLASKGFVVLQMPDFDYQGLSPAQEVLRAVSAFEGAVHELDRIGLIDPARVGLLGFSRTCLYVKYALAHSTYRFSAASVADGIDDGYFQYMVSANMGLEFSHDAEQINGGPPFGTALPSWIQQSPSFNLDKVRTPLRILAIGSDDSSLLTEWEWFSGLSRLRKPVDMIYLPGGTHTLQKPWDRMVAAQGNVDWFCFWLKAEEDPDPAKAQQYARWRKLREIENKYANGASLQRGAVSQPTPNAP
jgi:dipeptidyl aminopeptidase/acylaminoacyl peptidase